jgi:hypothetical protein
VTDWTTDRDPADDWELEEDHDEGDWEHYREPSRTGRKVLLSCWC